MKKFLLAATFLFLTGSAFAQTPPTVTIPPLAFPPITADDPICSDRPFRASVTCVVPEGHFQLESDLFNWTGHGMELATNPTLKYGIAPNLDLEINIAPYEYNQHTKKGGVGDLYLQFKWNFYNDDKMSIAVLPYIKIPTAMKGVGNGFVEGGVLMPVMFALPWGFTLAPTPEIDEFHNPFGGGYYTNLQFPVALSHTLFTDKLTGYVEIWEQIPLAHGMNLGYLGKQQQSVDVGLSYLLTPRVQLDVGFFLGLTESTPRQQAYTGISVRF